MIIAPEKYNSLLDKCIAYHGHLCMGQVLGVRIGIKGLELVNTSSYKELIVIVENDRCIADAVQTVTGTRFGRRSFKIRDYGRMAATFLNTSTNKAFRVSTSFYKEIDSNDEAKVRAVLHLSEQKVIKWQEVRINLSPFEMPGRPLRIVNCSICGERIFDGKDIEHENGPVCIACEHGSYYTANF